MLLQYWFAGTFLAWIHGMAIRTDYTRASTVLDGYTHNIILSV